MSGYSFVEILKLSLLDLWGQIIGILPNIIGAIVIIAIGLIIAPILGGLVKQLIDLFKVDALTEKVGLKEMMSDYTENFSLSLLIGRLVKWFFILAFVMAATEVLRLDTVTEFLNTLVLFIPQVLIAIIILVFGVVAGKFFESIVTRSLKGSKAPVNHPEALGHVTRWIFIVFSSLAALIQLGIAPVLIQILFTGLVLAFALAFGLGGRDKASKLLDYIDGSEVKKSKKK